MFKSFLSRSGSRLAAQSQAEDEPSVPEPARRSVLVTGAGGQTGSIVVRKLLERAAASPGDFALIRCLVRSEASEESLRSKLGETKGLIVSSPALFEVVIGDVTDAKSLEAAFKGIDHVVLATSAMPRISKLSLACVIGVKLLSFSLASMKPSFWYDDGQNPEQVDWLGQKAQFDAAEAAGVKHVVLVSSMCGTKPDHFLNTQMENIVLWKRKAECALVSSGLPYTIIHPGGLLPHPGGSTSPAPGGKRQLYVGVNDAMMESSSPVVPREDVAEVCVSCVMEPETSAGRSFDLTSGPEGEGTTWSGNLQELLSPLEGKNCVYSEADSAFCSIERRDTRGCHCY